MERFESTPRPDWRTTVESQGFLFHTHDEGPYWDESAYYSLSESEVEAIEIATLALNDMCLQAVDHVVKHGLFSRFGVPAAFEEFVTRSWESDSLTIYGRFDLAVRPGEPPRMLEYNAYTPTALIEAAIIQWYWMQDCFPGADQFNSIHERLKEAWSTAVRRGVKVHFTSPGEFLEDYMTITYLRDTAVQAGLNTDYVPIESIGWNPASDFFLDQRDQEMTHVFKLYPWEWMFEERFGKHLIASNTAWLEAPWKVLLSSKALLPLMHELFPDSPYLLEASHEPLDGACVRKPMQGREGANTAIIDDGVVVQSTEGPYNGPSIYQRYCELPRFDGFHPVIGSWMVNGHACGIGIREDSSPITTNTSRFVPHIIE